MGGLARSARRDKDIHLAVDGNGRTVKKKYAVRSQAVAYPAVERERFEKTGTALLLKIRSFRFYIPGADGNGKIGRCIGEIIAALFFCGIILTINTDCDARKLNGKTLHNPPTQNG